MNGFPLLTFAFLLYFSLYFFPSDWYHCNFQCVYWCEGQYTLLDSASVIYFHISLTKSSQWRVFSTSCQQTTIPNSCQLCCCVVAVWWVHSLKIHPFVSLLVFRIKCLLTIITFWDILLTFGMSLKFSFALEFTRFPHVGLPTCMINADEWNHSYLSPHKKIV